MSTLPLRLNKHRAVEILLEEAARADKTSAPAAWAERVDRLSRVCEQVNARTHIAALGIAILAKATDVRVDPFALKPGAGTPGLTRRERSVTRRSSPRLLSWESISGFMAASP